MGIPIADQIVIDTAAGYAAAQAGGPWTAPQGSILNSYTYPPTLFGRFDDPFFGLEPPLVTHAPWFGAVSNVSAGPGPADLHRPGRVRRPERLARSAAEHDRGGHRPAGSGDPPRRRPHRRGPDRDRPASRQDARNHSRREPSHARPPRGQSDRGPEADGRRPAAPADPVPRPRATRPDRTDRPADPAGQRSDGPGSYARPGAGGPHERNPQPRRSRDQGPARTRGAGREGLDPRRDRLAIRERAVGLRGDVGVPCGAADARRQRSRSTLSSSWSQTAVLPTRSLPRRNPRTSSRIWKPRFAARSAIRPISTGSDSKATSSSLPGHSRTPMSGRGSRRSSARCPSCGASRSFPSSAPCNVDPSFGGGTVSGPIGPKSRRNRAFPRRFPRGYCP